MGRVGIERRIVIVGERVGYFNIAHLVILHCNFTPDNSVTFRLRFTEDGQNFGALEIFNKRLSRPLWALRRQN